MCVSVWDVSMCVRHIFCMAANDICAITDQRIYILFQHGMGCREKNEGKKAKAFLACIANIIYVYNVKNKLTIHIDEMM